MSRLRAIVVKSGTPTVNDDVDAGYYAGFVWIDDSTTVPTWYVCLDASKSAAVWQSKSTNTGSIGYDSEITPAILTANVDDWNPAGIQEATVIRASAQTLARSITGIIAPSPESNKLIVIANIGTVNIILRDNDGASAAANRLLLGGEKVLQENEGITLVYDQTSDRWRGYGLNN